MTAVSRKVGSIKLAVALPLSGCIVAAACCSLFAAGLPGEYILTDYWRVLAAPHSPLGNPALLTDENYTTARVTASPILGGTFFLGEAGLTIPLGLYQSVGATVITESDGRLDEGVYNPSNNSFSVQKGTASNQNILAAATYAVNPFKQLSLGVNVNLAYQSAFGSPRSGLGVDAALAYRIVRHAAAGNHTIGILLQNLVAPTMDEASSSAGAYSRNLKLTWLAHFAENRVNAGINVNIRDLTAQAEEFIATGTATPEWLMGIHAGGWIFRTALMHALLGLDKDGLDYWGVSAGVNVPTLNEGRDLCFQYQLTSKNEPGTPLAHSFYVRAELGMHREEILARREARRLSLVPSELYNRAMKLFMAQSYWDAFFVFSQIESEYPDFFRNDWVSYYRGRCMEEMDMREQAVQVLRETKANFHLSSATPFANLALIRLYYRTGQFDELSNQFEEFDRPGTPDSLLFHGHYLMAEMLLKQGRLRGAIAAFDKVPPGHPDYLFSQHSAAVTSFLLNEEDKALAYLGTCLNATAENKAENELIQRSYLLAGYAMYESNQLANAVSALRLIKNTSIYYPDAALGKAWAALRAQQWDDCLSAAQELAGNRKYPSLMYEGALLAAYYYINKKDHEQALSILEEASRSIDSLINTPDQEPKNRRERYGVDRSEYGLFASDIDKLSHEVRASQAALQLDSLHATQNQFYTRLDEYQRYAYHQERTTFFARSLAKVQDDIDYAVAVVQNILSRSGIDKVEQKHKKDDQKLDQKIRELEGQLKTIEQEQ